MPDKFIISDTCPPKQRQLFEEVNAMLASTGISAEQFDISVRINMMAKYLDKVENNEISPAQKVMLTGSLDTKFRNFQNLPAEKLNNKQAAVLQRFRDTLPTLSTLAGTVLTPVDMPYENLLQSFASGKSLPWVEEIKGGFFTGSSVAQSKIAGDAMTIALSQTVNEIADLKWSPHQLVAIRALIGGSIHDGLVRGMDYKPPEKAAGGIMGRIGGFLRGKTQEEASAQAARTVNADTLATAPPSSSDYPFYLLPPDQHIQVTKLSGHAKIIPLISSELFLTPACIQRAKATGEYRFVTTSEAMQDAMDATSPDSPNGIRYVLFSRGGAANLKEEEFTQQINNNMAAARQSPWENKEGAQLNMQRYKDEALAESKKWVEAYNEQVQKEQYRLAAYKPPPTANSFANGGIQRFTKQLWQFDAETNAVLTRNGVKIVVDLFEETKQDISINEEKGMVIVSPQFLTHPHAIDIIRDRAIACAMFRQENKTSHIWELARTEMDNTSPKILPKHWGDDHRGMMILASARKDPKRYRTLLPIAYLADQQYDRQVHNYAQQLMNDATVAEFKATDTEFTLNKKALTSPQQAYFTKLNEVMKDLNVTPDELSAQFRVSALSASIGARVELDQQYPKHIVNPKLVELDHQTTDYMFGILNPPLPPKATSEEKEAVANAAYPSVYTAAPNVNILQSYASGERPLASLKGLPTVRAQDDKGHWIRSCNDDIFKMAMHNALFALAEKQERSGDKAVMQKIAEVDRMAARALQWQDELGQQPATKQPAPIDETRRAAAEKARQEAEQRRQQEAADLQAKLAAAEAARPAPYALVGAALVEANKIHTHGSRDIKQLKPNALAQQKPLILQKRELNKEIDKLKPLFNTKLPLHKDVGDILLNETTLRRAQYASELPTADKDKPRAHADGFNAQSATTLAAFFAQNPDDMPQEQAALNTQIRERILQSPLLVIAALGDDNDLKKLRGIQNEFYIDRPEPEQKRVQDKLTFERDTLVHGLLIKAGIDVPKPVAPERIAIEPAPTAPPAPVAEPITPVVTAVSPLITEPPPAPTEIPVVPASEPLAPATPREQAVIFESVTAANGNAHSVSPKISDASKPPAPPVTPIFSDDPGGERRRSAFEQSMKSLLAETEQHIHAAKENGFNHFECKLDVDNERMPIQLTFSKRYHDEDGKVRVKRMVETLSSHSGIYKKHDVPLTLGEAVDLKIAVQSKVFNAPGKEGGSKFFFEPPPFSHKPGVVDVSYGAELPADLYDRSKYMHPGAHVVQRSGGICALEINVKSPYSIPPEGSEPNILRVSFPLGVAIKPGTHEQQLAIKQQINVRKDKVLEFLGEVQQQRQQHRQRITVTKGDMVHKLQAWVASQGEQWEAPQHMPLEGFEQPQLLFVGNGEKPQTVKLAPVMLEHEIGGENPSWLMRLNFYINNDGTNTLGTPVRSRTVRLHTDNPALAVRRATESLVGVKQKDGTQLFKGLLPSMQEDMAKSIRENPLVQWTVEGESLRDKVKIGTMPLQHMLDDMKRYEHDIGINPRYNEQKSTLELTAIRSLNGDYGGKITPTPETLNYGGKPLCVSVPVPVGKEDKMAEFVKEVHEDMRWHAAEHFSSVSITGDKKAPLIVGDHTAQEDHRKAPAGYQPATAKNALINSVKAKYQQIFGRPLPAGWPEDDTKWTGKTSPRPGTGPSELGA